MPYLGSRNKNLAPKKVLCTHCQQENEVAQRAMSVFCIHCHKRLIIQDFSIKSYHAVHEFATCGDIVVEKRGHVVAPVKVGNLTVKGKLQGNVVARGCVKVHRTAWLKGNIRALALRVDSGAQIEGHLEIGPGVQA